VHVSYKGREKYMAQIHERLTGIKYQIIKGKTLSDSQKVSAARSLFDSAIDDDTIIPLEVSLPVDVFGVSMLWSEDKRSVVLSKGAILIEDNLVDTIVPSVDEFENYLFVNNEPLLINGDYLFITI
jgi:hypothetical protein